MNDDEVVPPETYAILLDQSHVQRPLSQPYAPVLQQGAAKLFFKQGPNALYPVSVELELQDWESVMSVFQVPEDCRVEYSLEITRLVIKDMTYQQIADQYGEAIAEDIRKQSTNDEPIIEEVYAPGE